MKYNKFLELQEEFGSDFGNQLAFEMCCGFTGDGRYCPNFLKIGGYWQGQCLIDLNPVDMKDWICPEHPLRNIKEEVKKEKDVKKEKKADLSLWFDIDY